MTTINFQLPANPADAVEALQGMLDQYVTDALRDRELAGGVLADDIQAYIDGLRKLTTE